ncbi:MAG: substrate-binding domain-containing protein [Actinobacteria bacterium]|nr:substrate-binding domain-containing protein [Actinomycetota bacterium]
MSRLSLCALAGALVVALAVAACGSDGVPLSGSIRIDGSTTVAPLTRALARRFAAEHPGVRIAVRVSGEDAGLARLCRGEADVGEADSPIGATARAACRRNGVAWRELPVAHDALVVIIARQVPIRCLTTAQLTQIWHRDSRVTGSWSQVDGLRPPFDGPMTAWGPGTDTEQFAFFNEAVNGRRDSYRDYNNMLHVPENVIPGVANTPGNLGYTEYALYLEHRREVRGLALDSGAGCVAPTPSAIAANRYRPLSRRLLLYPTARALRRPALAAFLRYYLDHVQELAPQLGFVAPTDAQLDDARARLEQMLRRPAGGA